ncbi:lysophospholipase [Rhodococcus sp. D2-41]|uniref:dienelactone hydrolase family protein n=1 Tax=Speluncibacter jeojiensis TaxID=2710754 RepID=UPI00240FF508|nr:alpha/beta fold hydrolase [Rhodococcus sp. D2-41]MDG3010644.1 lysophospholipase [Rhodococcus sp. D2-41]
MTLRAEPTLIAHAAPPHPRGVVLVLPGGKVFSTKKSRPWQLANLRMADFARRIARDDRSVAVYRVRYRRRGWNAPPREALRDAQWALDRIRTLHPAAPLVLVGHSMGGRVAAHLATGDGVVAVAALAPWWPDNDSAGIPEHCRLLVIHGDNDTWTDPAASRRQVARCRSRGMDATWASVRGGHFMATDAAVWHDGTCAFIRRSVDGAEKAPPQQG